jgi:capsular polysaccharide transport system ATP-binding protein
MLSVTGLTKRYGHGRGVRTLFEDLSFTLARGERMAIIGRNGQGKSTLLKILGGVLPASSGKAAWSMSSSWPLGFSGGFQGGMTGFDNVQFIARIYGQPREWLLKKVDEFAELGPALSLPVKYYSSGMRARLAFGLSIAIDFDCYLIDEVISVGDAAFRQKCHDELFGQRADRSFLIASHEMGLIRDTCKRAIIIERGRAKLFDDINLALEIYSSIIERHEREQAQHSRAQMVQ